MAKPLISVVIPSYKHERYIRTALESVYQQDYSHMELVVIDDCSPDLTFETAQEYLLRSEIKNRFSNIILIKNEINLGAHITINRAIHASSGQFVNILNSDDMFVPQRLSRLYAAAKEKQARFVFSGVEVFIDTGVGFNYDYYYFQNILNGIQNYPTVGYALLHNQCALTTGNFFFERTLFDEVGEFAPYKNCHDWDFILRVLFVTEPIFVPDALYRYRLHPTNSYRSYFGIGATEGEQILKTYFHRVLVEMPKNVIAPSPIWDRVYWNFLESSGYINYFHLKPG